MIINKIYPHIVSKIYTALGMSCIQYIYIYLFIFNDRKIAMPSYIICINISDLQSQILSTSGKALPMVATLSTGLPRPTDKYRTPCHWWQRYVLVHQGTLASIERLATGGNAMCWPTTAHWQV